MGNLGSFASQKFSDFSSFEAAGIREFASSNMKLDFACSIAPVISCPVMVSCLHQRLLMNLAKIPSTRVYSGVYNFGRNNSCAILHTDFWSRDVTNSRLIQEIQKFSLQHGMTKNFE